MYIIQKSCVLIHTSSIVVKLIKLENELTFFT